MADDYLSQDKELGRIISSYLKIESNPMSIETLFTGRLRKRIKYDPYYQRNYVWDKHKATYFIESILLGTEIPPLIFFNTDKEIEVIDGRQRFETIARFLQGDSFKLSEKGLLSIKKYAGRDYNTLDEDIKSIFLDTTLRVIEFSVVRQINEQQEDLIKKEIFRRYNSGITPLRKYEIEKAEYIEDNVTTYFTKQLKRNKQVLQKVLEVLFSDREARRINEPQLVDEVLMKVRQLLILPQIPIRYYESAPGKEVAAIMYENFSGSADAEVVFDEFMKKIDVLQSIKTIVSSPNPAQDRYLYETFFWALAALEQEDPDIDISNIFSGDIADKLSDYVLNHPEVYASEKVVFRAVTIARYETTARFFEATFGYQLVDIYINNNGRVSLSDFDEENSDPSLVNILENMRLHKPDAQTITVENLHQRMFRNRRKFLVRPTYQRHEAISGPKASAIIESMLLGIKLPPIFVFKRKDGVSEVVDGQQRLLSILGFLQLEFINEVGEMVRSKKDGFRLAKLSILSELNGKRFEELDEELKDKLWDFKLYIVNIEEQVNDTFDPVDLFIRLNNKPYPIRDDTFEMWNSLVDRNLILKLREKTDSYQGWFYLRKDNKRMHNENLVTTLAYLEYKALSDQPEEFIPIFSRGKSISTRITSKRDITRVLRDASYSEESKRKFEIAIKKTEQFIKKLHTLLLQEDVVEENLDNYLDEQLNLLIQSPTGRRTNNQFYILWIILYKMPNSMVTENRYWLRQDVLSVMKFVKNTEDEIDNNVQVFHDMLQALWDKYTPNNRNLRLSYQMTAELIRKQRNVCPICNGQLFVGDHVEADHIRPIGVGGDDAIENIQIVHWICNRKKGMQYSIG